MRVDPEEASALCDAPSGVLRYAANSPPLGRCRHGPSVCRAWPVLSGPIKSRVGFRGKRAPRQRRGSRAGRRESQAILVTCSDWGKPY